MYEKSFFLSYLHIYGSIVVSIGIVQLDQPLLGITVEHDGEKRPTADGQFVGA